MAFASENPALQRLPRGILCSEGEIRRLLHEIETSDLPLDERLALVERHSLWPFLPHASRARPEFPLLLDMQPGLRELRLYLVRTPLTEEQLNGDPDPQDLELLAAIPDPRLLFSATAIRRAARCGTDESIVQLFTLGKRLSRFRGVTVTWDQSVDRRVWTTNIDTVFLLDQVLERDLRPVRRALEVGVGGGGIAKTLVAHLPGLHEMVGTDISPFALACARRNVDPVLRGDQGLELYLGKGIRGLKGCFDLVVVNPPYIPSPKGDDPGDPYAGTGLLRELLELGPELLNPANPDAALYLQVSSVSQRDLARYPRSGRVETLPASLDVPLKILKVQTEPAWVRFLVEEHGLERRDDDSGFEYWHTLSVLRVTR